MSKPAWLMAALASLFLIAAPSTAPASVNNISTLYSISTQSTDPNLVDGSSTGWYGSQDRGYTYLCSTIGDSLTNFSALENVFYDRLNNPDYTFRSIPGTTQVAVHGYNGGQTGDILSMVNSQDLGAGEGANFVVIMAGTNDIDYSRGDNIQDLANAMVANVQAIIDSALGGLTDPNTRPAIIVAGIPGFTDSDAESRAKYVNDQLRTKLDKVDVFTDETWWDLYDPSTGTASASLMSDNKHPNTDGFYRLGEDWFKAVDSLFDPTRFQTDTHLYKGDWYFER